MRIQLWWCEEMKQWRYTISKTDRPIIKQESGQNPDLHQAMLDIENIIKFIY